MAGIGIGTTGQQSTPSYSASKAAVIHLTKNLAVELGPKNIRFNAIAPGFYVTRMVSLSFLIAKKCAWLSCSRGKTKRRMLVCGDLPDCFLPRACQSCGICRRIPVYRDAGSPGSYNNDREADQTHLTFQASGLIDKMGGVDEMAKSTPTQRLGEPEVSGTFSPFIIAYETDMHVLGYCWYSRFPCITSSRSC